MLLSEAEWSVSPHEADVAILGSGAAGISLALALAQRGVSVVVLEGGDKFFSSASQDTYAGKSLGDRHLAHGLDGSRLRFLGGSTNCWAGGCGELDADDFRQRSWIGGSGWPIDKKQLTSWYEDAAKFLGLDHRRIEAPGERAGLPALPGFELRSLEFTAKRQFGDEFSRTLQESPQIKLCLGANFFAFNRGTEANNVASITCKSFSGASTTFTAKAFVLACGGIENARILLHSEGPSHPGFGNAFDNVGRYFADHPIAPCASVVGPTGFLTNFPFDARTFYEGSGSKPTAAPYYRLPFGVQEKHATLNAAIQFHSQEGEFSQVEISALRLRRFYKSRGQSEASLQDVASVMSSPMQLYKTYSQRTNHKPARIALRFQIEQAPNRESRITRISDRDALGLNRVGLYWKFTKLERHTIDVTMAYTARCLQDAKLGTLRLDSLMADNPGVLPEDLRGGQHHSGTTRMAATEREGVVDSDLKVFNTKNLFVAGSSVFPTNGWVNPTLTIIALSHRLADFLTSKQLAK